MFVNGSQPFAIHVLPILIAVGMVRINVLATQAVKSFAVKNVGNLHVPRDLFAIL